MLMNSIKVKKFTVALALLMLCLFRVSLPQATEVEVAYRYPADAFHLIEQVSAAAPAFFQDEEYRKEWEKHFPISAADEEFFARYRNLRKKYQGVAWWELDPSDIKAAPDGLFAPHPKVTFDPISDVFFSADTFEGAFISLKEVVDFETLSFLREFFQRFLPGIESLLGQRSVYEEFAREVQQVMRQDEVLRHLKQIESFYGSGDVAHRALILWRPYEGGFSGASNGHYLFLQLPKEVFSVIDNALKWQLSAVLIHEATHSCSARAPREQKQQLTQGFLSRSNGLNPHEPFIFALEEPLVQVVSQALFFKLYHPHLFASEDCWFHHPLVQKFLPLVEQTFVSGKSFDSLLAQKLGREYALFHHPESLNNDE